MKTSSCSRTEASRSSTRLPGETASALVALARTSFISAAASCSKCTDLKSVFLSCLGNMLATVKLGGIGRDLWHLSEHALVHPAHNLLHPPPLPASSNSRLFLDELVACSGFRPWMSTRNAFSRAAHEQALNSVHWMAFVKTCSGAPCTQSFRLPCQQQLQACH